MTTKDLIGRLLRLIQLARTTIGSLWAAIVASRVVLLLALVVFYLLHSGQGEELTASLRLVSSYNNWLLFLAISAWAAQSWLWAKIAILLVEVPGHKGAKMRVPESVRELLPLLYAAAVFGIAIEPLVQAENSGVVSLIGVSSLSLFVGAAAWFYNRRGSQGLSEIAKTSLLRRGSEYFISATAFLLNLKGDLRGEAANWWTAVLASFCWSIIGFGIGTTYTLEVGRALGTLGTTFFAISILLPLLAVASLATRLTRVPIVTFLILAPFVLPAIYSKLLFSSWAAGFACVLLTLLALIKLLGRRPAIAAVAFSAGAFFAYVAYFGTNVRLGIAHEVRVIAPKGEAPDACSDPSASGCVHQISTEVDRWLETLGTIKSEKINYVVFVSAAGGGLRAGYWTASVLARLFDCVPNFSERLFAISGVSGGSLGAGLYASLVRDLQSSNEKSRQTCADHPASIIDPALPKREMQAKLTDFLENDFLAPVVASLFFRDLPQSLIPIQFIPDRAAILEKAFEQSWHVACASRVYGASCLEPNQFEESFFQTRDASGWTPVLFFNGTHEETGKRIITSHVRIDQDSFFDALDFFSLVQRDVALSTAVLNSARFPFVSPAGALTRLRSDGNADVFGSVIDGGFFENYGATTLQEVVDATLKHLRIEKPLVNWRPLVIEITNDADIPDADLLRRKNEMFQPPVNVPLMIKPGSEQDTEIANQLLSTALGLYATRTARGILASKMLSDLVVGKSFGEFVQFRLCPHMRPSPPLGWLLTTQSRNSMDQLILGHGRAEYEQRYASVLTGAALLEYKSCFDDVQQGLSAVRQLLEG
jgi:hypothetical protein